MAANTDKSELIRIALDGGATPKDIARDMGVSLRRVYQVRGTQTERPRIDAATRDTIARQLAAGVPQRLVAEQTGVTRKVVQSVAREIDTPIPAKHNVLPGEVVTEILRMHRAGSDTHRIAVATGQRVTTVRSVLIRNGGGLRADDDIMRAIVDEMRLRELKAADLCATMPPPPDLTLVHDYVAGRRSPGTVNASRMLRALGLRIVRDNGMPVA
jgi:hypothetical protein